MESTRYLTIRILYPKSDRTGDIISVVRAVSEAARKFEGLVGIGAWIDKENECIVNISLWESKELAMKATGKMHPMFAEILWSARERKPAEYFLDLTPVV